MNNQHILWTIYLAFKAPNLYIENQLYIFSKSLPVTYHLRAVSIKSMYSSNVQFKGSCFLSSNNECHVSSLNVLDAVKECLDSILPNVSLAEKLKKQTKFKKIQNQIWTIIKSSLDYMGHQNPTSIHAWINIFSDFLFFSIQNAKFV